MDIEGTNCHATVAIWREPIVQVDRPPDDVGPAMHIITGDGWALHACPVQEPRTTPNFLSQVSGPQLGRIRRNR